MKRVGFSLVLCRYIDMDVEATIGHFNLIIVDSLVMKQGKPNRSFEFY